MARNHVPQQQARSTPDTPESTQPTTPDEAIGESATPGIETQTTMPGDKYRHDAVVPERPGAPQRRQYEVTNTRDVPILYNGCHATLRPGKVIDDVAYDIPTLKRQGVKLQEIQPEPVE